MNNIIPIQRTVVLSLFEDLESLACFEPTAVSNPMPVHEAHALRIEHSTLPVATYKTVSIQPR